MTGLGPPGFAPPRWLRLHPLSPVVRVGGAAGALALVSLTTLASPSAGARRQDPIGVFVFVGLAVLSLASSFVGWWVTRWCIEGADLRLETGVLRRQSFRVPLSRIQAVDVVAPLLARLLGVAEVRVVSAGQGVDRVRLAYLSSEDATAVRAQLLALAHGLAANTPEPAAVPLLAVDNMTLALALSIRGPILVGVTACLLAIGLSSGHIAASQMVLDGVGPFMVLLVVAVLRAFNEDANFVISEGPDGLRLDRGLLQRRHETVPFTRIQAVRCVQPFLWRPFGWCRLEVDVARQRSGRRDQTAANQVAKTLMPVGPMDAARWLTSRVFPGATIDPPPGVSPPSRAAVKAPLSYHLLAAWNDRHYVCARTGRLQAASIVLPLRKVQSVRLSSGPVQRFLRLATVHVDTAGSRWQAVARCRDQDQARRMVDDIASMARDWRRWLAQPQPPA